MKKEKIRAFQACQLLSFVANKLTRTCFLFFGFESTLLARQLYQDCTQMEEQ